MFTPKLNYFCDDPDCTLCSHNVAVGHDAGVRDLLYTLDELVTEFDAKPDGHEGPWYGRNDTTGITWARQLLDIARERGAYPTL
jgi:hypothetical protein